MTDRIKFTKMTGSGNDFILIDIMSQKLPANDLSALTRKICHRSLSLGADGAIFLERSEKADFKWRFYNSDGSEAEMCGNGSRCAARFAFINKIAGSSVTFETKAGIIKAEVNGSEVKTELTKPKNLKKDIHVNVFGNDMSVQFINTGVPHAVIFVDDIEKCEVEKIGREIRYHKEFKPAGTNVNFVKPIDGNMISVRTYERGVEGETLACGTGSVASSIFHSINTGVSSPISVKTRGGEILKVFVVRNGDSISNVSLQGMTRIICDGELDRESWEYL